MSTSPKPWQATLARGLGIDLDHRQRREPSEALRSAALSVEGLDRYFPEDEPTVAGWLAEHRPTTAGALRYLRSLFPFWDWIFHYNLIWLLGDVVAGVTVGFVVIPQGMAYALLAQLSAEYGLYTSFVGFVLYWAFATSKDITIGTVAVMSQLVGNVILRVQAQHPQFEAADIARSLAIIAGAILLFIGLVRLGWIVEFIPLVAITSFMTGAAINIAAGQVPGLLGLRSVDNKVATYDVIIQSLRALPEARIDAALGLTALFFLYAVRAFCNFMSARQPARKKLWFFASTLRMAFVILLYILISYLANRNVTDAKEARFKILGDVPSGFRHTGVPRINTEMIKAFAPDLPATVIVLIIEHIAISKSFGRINNYVINPSQELVAVGFTNLVGPFLGAYPATGSFSRTAIKSKAGVRTPLAGIFTASIVLLALYVLTRMFFYIPMSSLAAIIIHAVGDLISPPSVVYRFWELSPLEVFIFFGGVFLTVFTTIEVGIYFTVVASAALLLYRLARAKGAFLGRVAVYCVAAGAGAGAGHRRPVREAFLPVDHRDGSNPDIDVQSPYPGIFVFRFGEGLNYLNQGYYLDQLVHHVMAETRRTRPNNHAKLGDRPWNDPGPRRGQLTIQQDARPVLRAVVLDMASVNNLDVTSVQGLIDVRNQLDRQAAPSPVEWHFASVDNRWARRALAVAGFGYPVPEGNDDRTPGHWRPIFSIAAVADASSDFAASSASSSSDGAGTPRRKGVEDEETGRPGSDGEEVAVVDATGGGGGGGGDEGVGGDGDDVKTVEDKAGGNVAGVRSDGSGEGTRFAAIQGMDRPFFHIDVAAAVESAVANARTT